jgi:manganese/iron transport system substrate-binding protein
VAAEAGVQVAEQELYSDSLGEAGSGAETYVAMMRLNTCTIVAALGGSPDCP